MLSNLDLKAKIVLTVGGFFTAGVLVWYLTSAKHHHIVKRSIMQSMQDLKPEESLVTIDQAVITVGDLDWEFNMVVERNLQSDDLIVPDDFSNDKKNLNELKQELFANLVERKVLYTYIQSTPLYSRFGKKWHRTCIEDFENSRTERVGVVQSQEDERKLQERSCELKTIAEYMEKDVNKREVSDDSVEDYYKNNPELFTFPTRATIRQIVLADEKTAKKVRSLTSKANFAELAKKYSITPEGAENGGIVGPFAKNELPAVFNAAFRMRQGQISGIQKSAYGFHIFYMIKKQSKGLQKLSKVRKEIASRLEKHNMSSYYGTLLESALAAVKVKSPLQIW